MAFARFGSVRVLKHSLDLSISMKSEVHRSPPPMKKRVTLTFPKRYVHTPVTYRLAKDFNVAASIIRAQVTPNQIGTLVVELSGDIDQLDAALDWMRSHDIAVSLASREIAIDEDVCVHCGLCTGICPTEALTLDPQTFKLNFTRSRCVVCEQCIPTCPVQAISTNL
jgi:L-aspartate semialdehyde sulfurtransferase ferredoxin